MDVKVDYNEKMILQDRLGREGKMTPEEQYVMKMEALQEIIDSGIDYCPCPEACPHHGKCWECLMIHRGHRDHLPYCMWDMINERLYPLQRLTEGSLASYQPADATAGQSVDNPCAGCVGSVEEK